MSEPPTIVVVAKECRPGRVKTRLTPPLSPEQAATVAEAALEDTLTALGAMPAARRVLFWDGAPRRNADVAGWEMIRQPDGTLDERLGFLFDHMAGPTLLVGMDTPQIASPLLDGPLSVWPEEVDAWLGPAADGGFWALAMREPDGTVVRGVTMSRPDTGAAQLSRLLSAGLRVRFLAELTDVDDARAAARVADQAPHSRFARAWRSAMPEGEQ
ncbi:DUF2064 domain-containing protein [Microbacter sp. GSS18]|nr:DUF2064 domain-containing protein [Microbacter sp. GSS18]